MSQADWVDVMSLAELEREPKRVVRIDGRQILILRTPTGVAACPNRCPHEGFPLREGELCADGTLRCHWHNWTFDLVSGETLVGGDRLTRYPVRVDGDRILVGRQAPDTSAVAQRAVDGIVAALDDADQARLLRETARLITAGGDPLDAVRTAVDWIAPRLQYGTTHAIGGAADWLACAAAPTTQPDEALAAIGEVLGHIADDGRRERRFPFARTTSAWDANAFVAAIERADEVAATAMIRGALHAGLTAGDLLPTLAQAALAHYADFGHSLIYAVKSVELAQRLGPRSSEALLCLLVRSLCFATREDLLPDYRAYAPALARWSAAPPAAHQARPPMLTGASIAGAIETVVAWSAHYEPEPIARTLIDSAAWTLLHVDESTLVTTSGTIAKNASWLNHTHALTFAQAGLHVARATPRLWPAVLLQLACFLGQSRPFIDPDLPTDTWRTADPASVFDRLRTSLFDHGRDRFIISVHLVKTLTAAERLVADGFADPPLTAAAIDRFFNAPMKGRHVLRTARQMLAVVAES